MVVPLMKMLKLQQGSNTNSNKKKKNTKLAYASSLPAKSVSFASVANDDDDNDDNNNNNNDNDDNNSNGVIDIGETPVKQSLLIDNRNGDCHCDAVGDELTPTTTTTTTTSSTTESLNNDCCWYNLDDYERFRNQYDRSVNQVLRKDISPQEAVGVQLPMDIATSKTAVQKSIRAVLKQHYISKNTKNHSTIVAKKYKQMTKDSKQKALDKAKDVEVQVQKLTCDFSSLSSSSTSTATTTTASTVTDYGNCCHVEAWYKQQKHLLSQQQVEKPQTKLQKPKAGKKMGIFGKSQRKGRIMSEHLA